MLNGIGLATPRGSGTSGYVQKNLAYYKPKPKTQNYKEILNTFKENPTPIIKKVNEEILKHDIQFKLIENELYKIKLQNLERPDLENFIAQQRKMLEEKYFKDSYKVTNSSHGYNYLQQKKDNKLKDAFNIKQDYISGHAFDLEAQEELKQAAKEKMKLEKKEFEKEKRKEEKRQFKIKERHIRKEKELILLKELERQEKELESEIKEKINSVNEVFISKRSRSRSISNKKENKKILSDSSSYSSN